MINFIFSLIPGKIGVGLRMIWFRYQWKEPKNINIGPFCEFISPRNINFRENANLSRNCYLNADGGEIDIGNNFSCNNNIHLNASIKGKIKIGDDVLIGPNVVCRTANHKFKKKEININKQGHSYNNIEIEKNVWVGANCVILSGVKIGEGAVIAAGAVVNSNVDSYTIAGGVPAKLIKKI